jgi:hypothetical protein
MVLEAPGEAIQHVVVGDRQQLVHRLMEARHPPDRVASR